MSVTSFPQLRTDPISGRQVIIAPERAARPGALTPSADALPAEVGECPLCEGREILTPPELYARRESSAPDSPGWRVRVVPNRYPAVRGELGAHELIVECPRHEPALENLPPAQVVEILTVYRDRLLTRRAEGWRYGQLFKNHGVAAGASLGHAHAQLVALPDVPPAVAAESSACTVNRCGFCELLARELADRSRLVSVTDRFAAVTAYAGRLPYELWILPRRHGALFEDVVNGEPAELGNLLTDVLRRLGRAAGRPAYNLFLHNGSWDGSPFHWHFELLPRMTGVAGFEWGAGVFINPLTPEDAAGRLRDA